MKKAKKILIDKDKKLYELIDINNSFADILFLLKNQKKKNFVIFGLGMLSKKYFSVNKETI